MPWNRSLVGRKRWRNRGVVGEAAFQDATISKVQAAEKNWNQENKRGKVVKQQRQNAHNTPHFQARPLMQQPLAKGALERVEEAAGHVERAELNAKFGRVPLFSDSSFQLHEHLSFKIIPGQANQLPLVHRHCHFLFPPRHCDLQVRNESIETNTPFPLKSGSLAF